MKMGDFNQSIVDPSSIENFEKELKNSHKIDFNILDFTRKVKREKVLPLLTINFMSSLQLLPIVDEPKLSKFLEKI